jgi:hypothetical protein
MQAYGALSCSFLFNVLHCYSQLNFGTQNLESERERVVPRMGLTQLSVFEPGDQLHGHQAFDMRVPVQRVSKRDKRSVDWCFNSQNILHD